MAKFLLLFRKSFLLKQRKYKQAGEKMAKVSMQLEYEIFSHSGFFVVAAASCILSNKKNSWDSEKLSEFSLVSNTIVLSMFVVSNYLHGRFLQFLSHLTSVLLLVFCSLSLLCLETVE